MSTVNWTWRQHNRLFHRHTRFSSVTYHRYRIPRNHREYILPNFPSHFQIRTKQKHKRNETKQLHVNHIEMTVYLCVCVSTLTNLRNANCSQHSDELFTASHEDEIARRWFASREYLKIHHLHVREKFDAIAKRIVFFLLLLTRRKPKVLYYLILRYCRDYFYIYIQNEISSLFIFVSFYVFN